MSTCFPNYEVNKENVEMQIRLDPWDMNSNYTIDIAYAAIVDSVDEISSVVTDDTYYLKSTWNDPGILTNNE